MKLKKFIFEVVVLIIFTLILRSFLIYKVLDLDSLVVMGLALCLTKIMV